MKFRIFGIVASLTLLVSGAAVNAADVIVDYSESLQQLTLTPQSSSNGIQKLSDEVVESMSFNAFGRNFQVVLSENHAIINAAEGYALEAEIGIYRGTVVGDANSWVRLTIADGDPRGLMWVDSDMYGIDDVEGRTAIFLLSDMRVINGEMICSQNDDIANADEFFKGIVAEVQHQAVALEAQGALSQLNLAVMGDSRFGADKGPDAEAEILTRMNNVDGIFSAQLGVQLNVNRLDVFHGANDPFSDETDASDLLDEVATYRTDTSAQRVNGLSHLFTGRNLDGSTVGIAYGGSYGGALCSRRFGAGLTQATHTAAFDSLIVAHELGHNFGSPHDGTDGSACEAETQDFLMAPRLNGSDTFSACSVLQMQDDISGASCITALPTADVSVNAQAATSTSLLGDSVNVRFSVSSNGTDPISGVVATVSVPGGVTLAGVSSSVGSCTSGAATVSCSLGTITPGGGATITLSVIAMSVGSSNFAASVSANGDANANNNQATSELTINPAIDLAVSSAGMAAADPGQSTTIQTLVENRSNITATGVTLTVTPAAGLSIGSVSWASGNCEVNNNVATCQAASVASQSGADLILQVSGSNAGIFSYTIAAAANEEDRDRSNDSFNGQVNVGNVALPPPPTTPSEASGGGGSFSLLSLLLLSLGRLSLRHTRRRK